MAGRCLTRFGWFVQEIRGHKVVWHYGHGFESSSLVLAIPDSHTTFVILANSDGLSRWRGLGDSADVTASPAAVLFLNWYFREHPHGIVGRMKGRETHMAPMTAARGQQVLEPC
jgi:hypothetical protein